MSTVSQLIELLEKFPGNTEVNVMVKEVVGFTEMAHVERLDLTPIEGANPNAYQADGLTCLETKHVKITDTRKNKGIVAGNRSISLTLGGNK